MSFDEKDVLNNTASLFKRKTEKKDEKDRDYSGSAKIEGVSYWISGWIREQKKENGTKFIKMFFKRKDAEARKS